MTDKLVERLPDDLVTITLEDGRTHDYVPLSALQHAQKEIERLTDVIIDDAQAIGRSAEACMGMMNQRDEAITRAEAAERERDKLRQISVDVLSSLVAAVSLLERSPKKAAPSDKMFDQMIADYKASISRARAALNQKEA
jgi:hypothetical protein